MAFQFYSNVISRASKRIAGGIFTLGLALIGFGVLIYLFPALFATIVAVIFCIMGIGACITAFKIYIAQHAIDKTLHNEDESDEYRRNVRIKIE
jgi:ABC-type bacteriocin/lantibiotic exporter with double-glycine peptidase domain